MEALVKPFGYPNELEADVLLADGRVAELRPIVPGDREALRALHGSLSPETVYLRFFSVHPKLSEGELDRFTKVDYEARLAIVAFVDDELVAVARYDRVPPGGAATPGVTPDTVLVEAGPQEMAEVAFTVRDDHQGRGLGTILLEHLASAARARGIDQFIADTLADNQKMLRVFRRAGFEERAKFESGVVRVTMDLEPLPSYLETVEERDRVAAIRSIERLLRPASAAVIGASRRPKTIGFELISNLVDGGFHGPIYPINPAGGEIAGLQAYASIGEVPGPVDLALIAVPAAKVAGVIEECGRKGVGGLIVISAGFAEVGADGKAAERELVAIARRHGMRLVGPNCMGIVNTAPDISMNATFSPVAPVRGHIAFSSQSGGLGIAILNETTSRDLGVSSFVSVGNKADVSSNDLLRYWEDDPETAVILLYLESFGNPRHFSRIARHIARTKPIIAVKSGRSSAGSRGASSHTAAMATPDAAVEALFRQAGVIRVDTLEEMFDVADVLSHQPLPAGNAVAILGNAGGPGVLAADACESYGLKVPELSKRTQERLKALLTAGAGVRNPVDCIASATASDIATALQYLLEDDGIDSVIVIFTPPLVTEADEVAAAVAEVAAGAEKTIVTTFLARSGTFTALRAGERRVPWFAYPESAARALGKIVPYAKWRSKPEPPAAVFVPEPEDASRARALVDGVLASDGAAATRHWLGALEAAELLGCYGIPFVSSVRVRTATEAVHAAATSGYPIALKLDVPGLIHKTDVGGVRLGLSTASGVRAAATQLLAGRGEEASLVVQPMVAPGVETIIGVVEDPAFGPLVMFGLGGTATEILGDRALSLVPLSRPEARDLIASLRSARLLTGYRGAPAADIDSLTDILCRVARLAEDLPEIVEMDLNPVVAGEDGCVVLDAKIALSAPSAPEPMLRRRHLR